LLYENLLITGNGVRFDWPRDRAGVGLDGRLETDYLFKRRNFSYKTGRLVKRDREVTGLDAFLPGEQPLYSKVAKIANPGTHLLGNLGAQIGNLGAQFGNLENVTAHGRHHIQA
jgi:hypothetical protein